MILIARISDMFIANEMAGVWPDGGLKNEDQ